MPTGENSIELREGMIYMKGNDDPSPFELKAGRDVYLTDNKIITWGFYPASMVDSVKKPEEFSFEVKLTPWQMIKIIFKHRGFWYTVAFILTRMWNKLANTMYSIVSRLGKIIEDKLNLG